MITIAHLTVHFGRTVALHDVNLELTSGIVGLFGPNASGKSTLLRSIAGLQKPTAGSVLVDGQRTHSLSEDKRALIGFAGHRSGMYGELTLKENLELFARLHGQPADSARDLLMQLRLDEHRDTPVAVLSAGLQRRAAVARALLHDPQILLLDEPYANLDDDASSLVSQRIADWFAPGRLAVVATHGAKKVRGYAHAGIVLQRGALAAFRPYAETEVG